MNKAELPAHIATETSPSTAGANSAMNAVFSTVDDALANGGTDRTAGIRTLSMRSQPAHQSRHPRARAPDGKCSKRILGTSSFRHEMAYRRGDLSDVPTPLYSRTSLLQPTTPRPETLRRVALIHLLRHQITGLFVGKRQPATNRRPSPHTATPIKLDAFGIAQTLSSGDSK